MQRIFYFVARDVRGDNENENCEKHACSKIYNILQVFIKSKKTVDALSLLTEEEEKAVRCIMTMLTTIDCQRRSRSGACVPHFV